MRYNDADQTPPVQTTAAQDEQIKQMTATDCINYLFQTVFEILLVVGIIYGFVKEDKLIAFEDKLAEKFKKR